MEYNYKLECRPLVPHQVANEVPRLRRSEEEQDRIDDEVPCFVTGGSPREDAAQPEHREAMIFFCGSTEAENRTEHTIPSTVLNVVKEPKSRDLFILEERLQTRKMSRAAKNGLNPWTTPSSASTSTDTGYWCEESNWRGSYRNSY